MFKNGAYATVWEVRGTSETMTKVRISTSRKNKDTDSYEQDFGGYVAFVGTAAARKALSLQPRDRIKLEDVAVGNKYDKERHVEYTNFYVYSFKSPAELTNETNNAASTAQPRQAYDPVAAQNAFMPEDVPFDAVTDEGLPF